MRDFILIPHLYDINWAKDINDFLSSKFFVPQPLIYKSYLPSKTEYHHWLADSLLKIRASKIKNAFLVNVIEDFSTDLIKAGFIEHFYGLIHGSNFLSTEVGRNPLLQKFEVSSVSSCTKVFVATHAFAQQLPYHTEVIGLPIFGNFYFPKQNSGIMFNARLRSEKKPLELLCLPERLKKEVVISVPYYEPTTLSKLKKEFTQIYIKPDRDSYENLLETCGFWVSFSKHETFGYGLMDAIRHGLFPIAPNDPKTSYPELLFPENLYNDVLEIEQKYDYYMNHAGERMDIISALQDKIEPYRVYNWYENLSTYLI